MWNGLSGKQIHIHITFNFCKAITLFDNRILKTVCSEFCAEEWKEKSKSLPSQSACFIIGTLHFSSSLSRLTTSGGQVRKKCCLWNCMQVCWWGEEKLIWELKLVSDCGFPKIEELSINNHNEQVSSQFTLEDGCDRAEFLLVIT